MVGQEVVAPVGASVRDRSKARRRAAILDSTLTLLRTAPLDTVSIEAIAAAAGVAPATVYNLIGPRDRLLLACVDRVLESLVDDLVQHPVHDDPVAAARHIIERSCAAFIDDGDAFRQVVAAVNGLSRAGASLSMDPAQLQVTVMRAAHELGMLNEAADPVAIGRQVFLSFNGALFAWAARQLSDDGFRAAALHGLWTVLAAFGAPGWRDEFVELAQESAVQMVAAGYGRPHP
jgi:AcrR family transcriptional regulator